jgi:putative transposase
LREAEVLIETWRRQYDTARLHSSLGYRPPAPETIIAGCGTPVPWPDRTPASKDVASGQVLQQQ